MGEPLLFSRFPRLRGRVPWLELGNFPTPVERMAKLGERLGCDNLWVKRDDVSGAPYGGNKVRKLEFTLAEAKAKHMDLVITFGAAGSNHVLATTIYARQLGLRTIGVLGPQPVQEYLRRNLLADCAQGCLIKYTESMNLMPLTGAGALVRQWVRDGKRPYLLWVGGSNTVGVLGYVEAALEIAEQVRAGQMPAPEYIFVPVGSAGTFAGICLGVKLAGLAAIPVGVRVAQAEFANERVTAIMANRALRYLRKLDPSVPDFKIDKREIYVLHDYCGVEYARYTVKGVEAVAMAKDLEGLKIEGTYSGKTMAAFIDFMRPAVRRQTPALFINTYNSRPLDSLIAACPGPEALPKPLQRYFREAVAEVGR